MHACRRPWSRHWIWSWIYRPSISFASLAHVPYVAPVLSRHYEPDRGANSMFRLRVPALCRWRGQPKGVSNRERRHAEEPEVQAADQQCINHQADDDGAGGGGELRLGIDDAVPPVAGVSACEIRGGPDEEGAEQQQIRRGSVGEEVAHAPQQHRP